ncbi:ribonuclease P protein component [Coxiella-like endosymbiont]|nr:ribonuclease P protein component [Coxiella-like endosymbiont]
MKEQFRLQKHRLPSIDIVFIAKSQLKEARKQELHKCVNELFNQLIM